MPQYAGRRKHDGSALSRALGYLARWQRCACPDRYVPELEFLQSILGSRIHTPLRLSRSLGACRNASGMPRPPNSQPAGKNGKPPYARGPDRSVLAQEPVQGGGRVAAKIRPDARLPGATGPGPTNDRPRHHATLAHRRASLTSTCFNLAGRSPLSLGGVFDADVLAFLRTVFLAFFLFPFPSFRPFGRFASV